MARWLMFTAEWAFFEPFVTGIRGCGGRPASNHRQVLDGVFWIARTGAQWRDLPEDFGKWSSVYRRFRRWTLGPDPRCAERKRQDAGPGSDDERAQMIRGIICSPERPKDSKTGFWPFKTVRWVTDPPDRLLIRLPLHDENPPDRERPRPADEGLNQWQRSLRLQGIRSSEGRPPPGSQSLHRDKGYDSNHIRDAIAAEGGTPVSPATANRKTTEPVDRITYALRNHVERGFNKMKCSRRLATRYHKTAASHLGVVQIAAARLWVRCLAT